MNMPNVGRPRSGRGTLIVLLLSAFANNASVVFAADSETVQQRVPARRGLYGYVTGA
jgi:hypothetical protein